MMTPSGGVRAKIVRRLEAIEARLEAFGLGPREVERVQAESQQAESDRVRRLEDIEQRLARLEERLRGMEQDLRSKESPPETFGTAKEFSTGMHYPGLG
jgi:hypothetical protein